MAVRRLTRKGFSSLKKERARVQGAYFAVSCYGAARGARSTACVVSKKVASSAVHRNAIKRRCREAIRTSELPEGAFVFRAKRAAGTAPLPEIGRDLRSLIEKIKRTVYNAPL